MVKYVPCFTQRILTQIGTAPDKAPFPTTLVLLPFKGEYVRVVSPGFIVANLILRILTRP